VDRVLTSRITFGLSRFTPRSRRRKTSDVQPFGRRKSQPLPKLSAGSEIKGKLLKDPQVAVSCFAGCWAAGDPYNSGDMQKVTEEIVSTSQDNIQTWCLLQTRSRTTLRPTVFRPSYRPLLYHRFWLPSSSQFHRWILYF